MDSDYARNNISPKITSTPPSPPPSPPEPAFIETQKQSSLPYLAKLTAFTVVFLSILYAISSLVTYLVEKLLVKQKTDSYDYSYLSGFDNYAVVFAVATLIVALPAGALLLFLIRRSEKKESWRSSQKWRRIIYTVTQVILITTVISTIIGTVYSVFSLTLNLETSSSYYSTGNKEEKPDSGAKIAAAVISGLVAVVIFSIGIVTLASEYASKWRPLAWVILLSFTLAGAIIGGTSIIKVQENIKKQNDSQSKYDPYSGSSSYDDGSSLDSSNSSSAKSDLQLVKGDLTYYANSNGGKYPTKAQWDDGSLKPKYLLSSDAKLKKITYAPEGCVVDGCSSYTISMKDENDKTITLNNTSDNSY